MCYDEAPAGCDGVSCHIASSAGRIGGVSAVMSVAVAVAVIGIVILLGLGVVVGRLEARAQRAAWVRIAGQRRELADLERHLVEQRAMLLDWESALVEESERRLRRL